MISVKTFKVGFLPTNCYVIIDEATGLSAVIDPACNDKTLIEYLDSIGKDKVQYVFLTHGHFDHIGYAYECAQRYDAKIVVSSKEKEFLSDPDLNLSEQLFKIKITPFEADIYLEDNDSVTLGDNQIDFLLTPGHTMGSGCYICKEDGLIFSGDTLFYLSMGRADFPTGDAEALLDSLRKLSSLSGDYKVYPGHDRETSLSFERENNPYIR